MELVTGGSVEEGSANALIIGVGADRAFDATGDWVIERLGDWLGPHLDANDFRGKPGTVVSIPARGAVSYDVIVMVGVGDDPDMETLRRAAGSAGRATSRHAVVATALHHWVEGASEAVVGGFLLGQYRFDRHRSEAKPSLSERLVLFGDDDGGVGKGEIISTAVAFARDLVNEPSLFKPPEAIASIAADVAVSSGIRIVVWDDEAIKEGGLGGLAGVAAGAATPARMVELWWEPAEPVAFLALVGKGIVFDSGGLSLKPASGMEDMKTDMAGAAAVIGAMQAIAALDLPVKVAAFAPLTENMPGGAALRPGDVVRARNGKTIEVLNTDAEGRLVLADALSLAAEAEPDLIVDLATLTGACKVALGDKIAGVFGAPEDCAVVQAAADRAGERVWPMPMPSDYRPSIDSDIADMKNTGSRWGGAIHAALLLKEFTGGLRWAHLDIAGPARASETEDYTPKGASGFGVRTLIAIAEDLAKGSLAEHAG